MIVEPGTDIVFHLSQQASHKSTRLVETNRSDILNIKHNKIKTSLEVCHRGPWIIF